MKRNPKDNAFEKFINDLLKTHNFNDELKDLVDGNESLHNSVDQILFESQLEAFFIEVDNVDTIEYNKTINKLEFLETKITQRKPVNTTDYNIVRLIKSKFSERDIRLSNEILLYLNELNREYS